MTRTSNWINIKDQLPDLDEPVRIWYGPDYWEDYHRELIGRRVQTNHNGDWYWYSYIHNILLEEVTHWAYQIKPI